MKIVLLGYFGQNNFGDEATNRAIVKLLLDEFGDIELYLLNQARCYFDYLDSFVKDCDGLRITDIQTIWFDSISSMNFDLLAVCNGGFIDSSFCHDVAIECIDRNIPVRLYSIKRPCPTGDKRKENLEYILNNSAFGIFRTDFERNTCNTFNQNIISGLDIAYFIEDIEIENNNKILFCLRENGDENNSAQIEFIKNFANQYNNKNFGIFYSNEYEKILSLNFDNIHNIQIYDYNLNDVISMVKIIKSSKQIISFGRLHPIIFSLKYKINNIYIDNGITRNLKLKNFCDENMINTINLSNHKDDIYDKYEKISNNVYDYSVLSDKLQKTMKVLGLDK